MLDLFERVEKLERENRRIKRCGITLLVALILASLTMGAARKNYAAFDWISAYGFTIRDDAARDRGGLAYHPKVGPYFYLKDAKGNTRYKIGLDGASRQ